MYFRIVYFLLPLMEVLDFFSSTYSKDLTELLEIKLTKALGLPYDWVLMDFLIIIFVHTESATSHQLQFFSYPVTDS